MTREALEFLISQYIDGQLSRKDVLRLERILAADGEARALLDEYQKLQQVLKSAAPVPDVQWDVLSDNISGAIAEADLDGAFHGAGPMHRIEGMRVGDIHMDADDMDQRAGSLKMPWVRNLTRVAIAASILLATAVGVHHLLRSGPSGLPGPANTPLAVQIDVAGPQIERATGPAIAEVTIGPSKDLTPAEAQARFADSVVGYSPHIVVASSTPSAQDSQLPY